MKKGIFYIMCCMILTSCGGSKDVQYITRTKQPDSCLTNKQYKRYLNFVKDSMRIENKKQRHIVKYEYKIKHDSIVKDKYIYKFDSRRFKDSLKSIRKRFKQHSKQVTKQSKYKEKTNRTGSRQNLRTYRTNIRQTQKTKRYKWWICLIVGLSIGFVVGKIKLKNIL